MFILKVKVTIFYFLSECYFHFWHENWNYSINRINLLLIKGIKTKAMKARVKLENKDFLLKPAMRANIKISYSENQKMIAVPSSAIVFDKSKFRNKISN